MVTGQKIFKKLVKGYRKSITKQQAIILAPPTVIPSNEPIFLPQSQQRALQSQQPIITTYQQKPFPVGQNPSEVKGTLELVPHKEIKKLEGLEIPLLPKRVKPGRLKTEESAEKLNISYPLIPRNPQKGEPVFAYAKIFWDTKTQRYVYQLVEPELTDKLKEIMVKVRELLEQKLDVDFSKLKATEARDFINQQVNDIIEFFKFRLTPQEGQVVSYYIDRDFIGLGKIEPFMRDPNIEDVSCDGVNIPIFIFHRNSTIGSVMTNVSYSNPEELDSFIVRLSQLCGKSISVAQPLLDGTLPDGSRLQSTLATDIARRGSNFTIRRFTETPLTPVNLLNYGTLDVRSMAYLWLAVDFGKSILVCGGTASGKTSLLNVLSLFIRPDKKIISIEDTAELQLPHPHWVPSIARSSISSTEKIGEVDMFDLLKESLRQRPDYIIVGEVRGSEAYILFQQMATGHPSLSTMHAENMQKLVDRLTTPPISLPPGLIESLDVVVFLLRMRHKEKFVRRVSEIFELEGFDAESKQPITNRIFKWDPINDKFDTVNKSTLLKKISGLTGLSEENILDELERRMLVLSWMKSQNMTDYRTVYQVINMYYNYPTKLLGLISGER